MARVVAVYPLGVVAQVAFTAFVPQPSGALALVPILAPHLLLSTLLVVPVAVLLREPILRVAVAVSLAACVVMLGSEWFSWPSGESSSAQIAFTSWNRQVGARTPGEVVSALREQDADVIALQELTNGDAAAIQADEILRSRYPYRLLAPDPTVLGLGVLSAYPISAQHLDQDPPSQTVHLDLGQGRRMVVVNVHPLPGRIGAMSFDGTRRDEDLRRLRARVDRLLDGEDPVVVIGDLNVASSEPAYRTFAEGFLDVHREVGQGPGWTWRPNRLAWLGIAVLRIDYVLAGPSLVPLTESIDCSRPGDHCMVLVTVGIP